MRRKDGSLNPTTWSYRGWRRFFGVSALWNLSGAVPAIIRPGLNLRLFYSVETEDYITLFLNRGLWWAVLIFGVGYFIVSLDPGRHVGIIIMGIMGNIIIAINWFYLFSIDRATIMAVLAGLGDSGFTVLFILYLASGPRTEPKEYQYDYL